MPYDHHGRNCSCHLGHAPCSSCERERECQRCGVFFMVERYDDPEEYCEGCAEIAEAEQLVAKLKAGTTPAAPDALPVETDTEALFDIKMEG